MQTIPCRRLTKTDLQPFVELTQLYVEAFDMHDFVRPSLSYLSKILENNNILLFVAIYNNAVIAGLTAHILPSTHFESSEIYIYDFAVAKKWQRQGVGRQLLNVFKNYCAAEGYHEIFVQADVEDQHALDFYKATGGLPEDIIQFSYGLQ